MREIKLTQGKVALVDDFDFEYLSQFKWYYANYKNHEYAVSHRHLGEKVIHMHRVIMNTPKGKQVDHIDHNGLNNQRCNLRNCTARQNAMNRTAHGSSKYLGVSFNKKRNRYRAGIGINGIGYQIGYFKTEEEAAKHYDKKAKELFGEYANINFKEAI